MHMGFLDKFKRKKAVLIPEEKQVALLPKKESQQVSQDLLPGASSMQVLSQSRALKNIKRKKRAKKRRVMKKRVKPKRRKAVMGASESRSLKMEDGTSTKKWLRKDRELLGGALKDLNNELQGLRNARKRLELKMASYSSELGNTQEKEISLRNKISELMKREAAVTKKKTTAKDKIALMDQKIEKVKTIQAELKNI